MIDSRHKRYPVGEVRGSLRGSLEVRLIALGLTGMEVETTSAPRVGDVCSLRLGKPDGGLQVEVEVAWCRLDRTQGLPHGEVVPVFRSELSFRNHLTDRAPELLEFIEGNIVVEPDRRVAGRMAVASDSPAAGSAFHDFVVKSISLSGMLVETEALPRPEAILDLDLPLGEAVVQARGRVAFVETRPGQVGRSAHLVGVRFVTLPPTGRSEIKRLIEGLLE